MREIRSSSGNLGRQRAAINTKQETVNLKQVLRSLFRAPDRRVLMVVLRSCAELESARHVRRGGDTRSPSLPGPTVEPLIRTKS